MGMDCLEAMKKPSRISEQHNGRPHCFVGERCGRSTCAVHKNHKAGLVGPAVLLWNWFADLFAIANQNVEKSSF